MIKLSLLLGIITIFTSTKMDACPTCCAFEDQYVAPFFADERYNSNAAPSTKKPEMNPSAQNESTFDADVVVSQNLGEAYEENRYDLSSSSTQQ